MKKQKEQYDSEFAQKVFRITEIIKPEKIFFKNFIVTGIENLLENKDRQRIYLANHLSHMDYVLLWLEFHKQKIKMPMIPAGSNLNRLSLKIIGLNFGRLGAYFINRDLIKTQKEESYFHTREIINTTQEIMRKGLDILIFPEGGRSYSGKLFEKYNTGILRHALREKKDIDIIPIAFKYNNRVEKKFIKMIERGNRRTLAGKLLYYGTDTFAYFVGRPVAKAVGCDVGNAYMTIGKSESISKITKITDTTIAKKSKSIKNYSIKEITKLYNKTKTEH